MSAAPDTLPPEVADWIGQTRYPETANFPVERGYLWTCCASVENGNPLFWDDKVAAEVTGGPIAPPTTLSLWFRPHAWEPGEVSQRLPLQVHFDLKERLGLPEAVMSESEVVFAEPVRPGDVVSTAQVLRSVSPPKTTKLGSGRFWVIDVEYRNQDGTLVGTEIFTGFGYVRRGGRETAVDTDTAAVDPSPLHKSHRRDATADPLAVEQVAPGEVLAPLDHEVTATTVVLGALATRDWRPMHHDVDFAVNRNGARDIFLNTPNQQAWFERYLTDWSGPRGRLGRLRFRMSDSVYPGDTMRLAGTVTAVGTDEWGCGWAELDLSLQAASRRATADDGPTSRSAWRTCTTGKGRIALPTSEIPNPWTLGSDSWNP